MMDAKPEPLPVRYRLMALADVPRVHEIDKLSFSMPWTERSYRFELSENRNSLILVAEVEAPGVQSTPSAQESGMQSMQGMQNTPGTNGSPGDLVGMIVVWVILDEAHIATIAVHPAYRGQGIGRGLLARGLGQAYERGARLAFLEVRRSNLVAQKMYENFGFKVVGQRPRYYQDNNEDALLMTLDPLQAEALRPFVE